MPQILDTTATCTSNSYPQLNRSYTLQHRLQAFLHVIHSNSDKHTHTLTDGAITLPLLHVCARGNIHVQYLLVPSFTSTQAHTCMFMRRLSILYPCLYLKLRFSCKTLIWSPTICFIWSIKRVSAVKAGSYRHGSIMLEANVSLTVK